MKWTLMCWGDRMFILIKQDCFYPGTSVDFPGAVLHVPCGLLWRGNNCTIKLLGKEFGLTVQPEPGTTHTPPVVQWRILNVPAPLEILLKEFADLELAFKLMPNISLNQYRIKIKFLVSGWDVREVLQQLQHWPWAINRNSKEKPSPTRNSGTVFFFYSLIFLVG